MFGVGCSMFDVPLGSWRASFRFSACIGTMNQIGTPLPALSPQGGERVAEGRERGGSWEGWDAAATRRREVARDRLSLADNAHLHAADRRVPCHRHRRATKP